ncbi:Pyruvate, water dikinase [Desulfobulbus propionicus DSM 2032]|jgi:pyruvate,water dikinase|uniref:Phosphoenolpyruvate synthase n=1 Tax=Desulfobulbus propionicus (strain ATCC 33891 / DSM 2032 / VKM B-1956 / 1pr3) TaxID=577650 RepID=A0A7U4DQE0_DESPD|nr:PEP/pyruvate-binding domain-containing protein [Desulfobulbus propionicus]ADW18999.1 Pyruvate, water dikinase [Desulfobulbus propionicus DSM 2032]
MLKKLAAFSKKFFFFHQEESDPVLEAEEVEALRLTFKSRYHSFKLLLAANTRILEAMAEIERALQGNEPFSMSFVQTHCTSISVNVFRMINDMENIAPGKYTALRDSFLAIQKRIDALLGSKKQISDTRLVIPLEAVNSDMTDLVGGKMANLGDIKNRLHMHVPSGFVITAAAHEMFMQADGLQREIDRLFQVAGSDEDRNLDLVSSQIRQLIMSAEVPEPIYLAVVEAYTRMKTANNGQDIRMAVRSSAFGEDAENTSFAGQYRSELNVGFSQFFYYYKQVMASKYSVQAIAYKLSRGFRDEDIAMCVGCLAMIDAVAGGVIYTRNPLDTKDDAIYINSVWGLPKAVVDGDALCDLFVVARDDALTILRRDVREKGYRIDSFEEEGCIRTATGDEQRTMPSLTDEQVQLLADHAVRIEQYYETPQDIEWAIDTDGKVYILQSRPLQQMESILPGPDLDLKRFESSLLVEGGINASPGVACGKVFKVAKKVDILQFPEGAVLVVEQALPTWAPLVARAAAVVSEQGGFAGHLANVAREFGIPAVFGVSGAMAKMHNGDAVTVAADLGQVYLGNIAPLLEWTRPEPKLMLGSPVYESLKEVSRHIIPLHLLDPESRDFVPQNCQTFHDITRFIHEKSVYEMFNFGKDHSFSERSSKQLYYRVPMNWWILNLDDGFTHEIHSKYVKLEDIASIPMLAFWEGFAAIPWDGPPAMDGKGMTSIMFRSTMNTALVPGIKSKYADRNYFMVSRNYCTLSSRLGYHFSTMEAMVSERSAENYLGFKFKGGAADFERCLGRVHFIREILERYGFRAMVNGDNLDARMEGHDMDYMLSRLKILGYLTLHTRQLDMIMNNSALVGYYMNKLTKDIDSLLQEQYLCTA